ncbi:uncharacterized protein LOC143147454 [Ptiloglossa arizonensis]|uniref:uncharacterized protein LOC143147454 n=1 Tax=Ptiloglossa arizonensis TaxID=3350558 RepID=UPI003F9F90ED
MTVYWTAVRKFLIFSTEFLDETRNYRIDDVQNKMWTTMAQEVNASAAECKKKWQNLCAIFGKHLKRRRTTKLELKKCLPNRPSAECRDSHDEAARKLKRREIVSKAPYSCRKNEQIRIQDGIVIRLADDSLLTHRCSANCIVANKEDHVKSIIDANLLPGMHRVTSQEHANFKICFESRQSNTRKSTSVKNNIFYFEQIDKTI